MWPDCINNLTPFEKTPNNELPQFIIEGYKRKGIVELSQMSIPMRIVNLLGKCSTDKYIECPNLPEWHIENYEMDDDPTEYLEDIGKYYWFDFDIWDKNITLMAFRAVFNEGDADCNDGTWGACWDKYTEELVANFTSTGDCVATVEVISPKYIEAYQPHKNIVIPPKNYDEEYDEDTPFSIEYANNLELEKLIGLAIRYCCLYRR